MPHHRIVAPSSKNVPLLHLDRMHVKKFPVFILEPLFSVPHTLVLNVANGNRYLRVPDAECAISILPSESTPTRKFIRRPL